MEIIIVFIIHMKNISDQQICSVYKFLNLSNYLKVSRVLLIKTLLKRSVVVLGLRRVTPREKETMLTQNFGLHRPSVRTSVCPPFHVCQCDQYHVSVQHTPLSLDINVMVNFYLSNQRIR